MKKIATPFLMFFYLIITLVIWGLIYYVPHPSVVPLAPQYGSADLAHFDFSESVAYFDNNSWDQFPNQFLSPADFESETPPVPADSAHADWSYTAAQYATHRIQLKLVPGGIYAINLKSSDYAMRIFINGVAIDSVGTPATNPETNVPQTGWRTYFFTADTGDVTVLVQASNWVHREGAYPPGFYVGTADNIETLVRYNTTIGISVTACLLTSFLYYFGIFLLNRKRFSTLIFSLCCLLLSQMNSSLLSLFLPNISWYIAFRTEYVVHCLTFAMLMLFLDLFSPKLLHRAATMVYYIFAAMYILINLFLPTVLISRMLIGFEVVSIIYIFYIMIRLATKLRTRKPQYFLAFFGFLFICIVGINDILKSNNIFLLPNSFVRSLTTPLAMVFMVFCYGLALSLDYAEHDETLVNVSKNELLLRADNAALDRINRSKSALISNLTHELRTPLTVMSAYAQMTVGAIKSGDITDQTTKDLELISAEAERLSTLASNVLQYFSNTEVQAQSAPFPIEDTLYQIGHLSVPMLRKNGNVLNVETENDIPNLNGRAEEFTQLLLNLISNAAAHTKNGVVTIRAGALVAEDTGEKTAVTITVRDNGSGIDPAFLPHVFERRTSESADGAGLGLSICKNIVEAHGGTIAIESELNKGTTVRMVFPIQKKEA